MSEEKPFAGKHGPLLIAEIGGNHEGDFTVAKRLVQLAIDTDVDYVKLQVYSGDQLVSRIESPDRNTHFKRFELTKEQHLFLASMIIEAGIKYTASIWDLASMEWLDKYMTVYKVGSGDLTAYSMLKHIASRNKPIIMSTGLSTEQEVMEAVKYIQSCNPAYRQKDMLALLQCTSMYPIPPSDANLAVMSRLRELSGLTIGYSDHTEGSKALEYAVALGAEILEFHFTDSREGKVFRDHKVSLTPGEVTSLIKEIRLIGEYRGLPGKEATAIELQNNHVVTFRRAVYPSRDIQPGEVLDESNLTVLRPNSGIDARDYFKVLGKRTKRELKQHQKLLWEYLE